MFHRQTRHLTRITVRTAVRNLNRSCLRGRRRGPDDLSQAITAMGRALRAHRRLARLAPSFFDPAVMHREAENHAERRRWMATWEPYIAKAYGVEPRPPETTDDQPPLPPPRIQRQVNLKLAEWQMSLDVGHTFMERYRQRHPHALMSFSRMARLLEIGLATKRLACGLENINPLPDKLAYDYNLTDLKRAYGHLMNDEVAAEPPPRRAEFHEAQTLTNAGNPDPPSATPTPAAPPAPIPPVPPRCDAWSRWARQRRQVS